MKTSVPFLPLAIIRLCKWDILCFLWIRTEAEETVEHGASSIGYNILQTSYTWSVTRNSDLFG